MKISKILLGVFAAFVAFYLILLLSSVVVQAEDFETDYTQDFEVVVDDEDQVTIPSDDPSPTTEPIKQADSDFEEESKDKIVDSDEQIIKHDNDFEEESNDNIEDSERLYTSIDKLNDTVYQIQLNLQELRKEIANNTIEKSSNVADPDENKKNVTEEETVTATLDDLHDDNFKVMICIFLALGIIIGFLMITKFLI